MTRCVEVGDLLLINDELKIYRGSDIYITDKIIVTQPTIGQIEEFGEQKYFSGICTLTSVGVDMIYQLTELGLDFTKISDYELFIKVISQMVSSKKTLILRLRSSAGAVTLPLRASLYILTPFTLKDE